MAISLSTIEDDTWQTIYNIIKNDTTVQGFIGSKIYSSYPNVFIEDAGGMPFVIVHRPRISEKLVTLDGTKVYGVSIRVDNVHKRGKEVKQLADAVRNALESNKTTTESNGLYDFSISDETEDFDFRDKIKIHYSIFTVSYEWRET